MTSARQLAPLQTTVRPNHDQIEGRHALSVGMFSDEVAHVALTQWIEALVEMVGAGLHQHARMRRLGEMGRQRPLHQPRPSPVRIATASLRSLIDSAGFAQGGEQRLGPIAAVLVDGWEIGALDVSAFQKGVFVGLAPGEDG